MTPRILVVEDSPTQAAQVRLLLEGAGYRVDVARHGREALERLQTRALPDLIVSDVHMPEMDGYALCEAVKSADVTRHIPFLLLTERNHALDIITGLERGADTFLSKPFQEEEFLHRLGAMLEGRRGEGAERLLLDLGGRQVPITANKQQILELLCGTFGELAHANARLEESRREVGDYAQRLESMVEERTQQLLQAEKLAWMGQLLASIAHELNNPLSVVVWEAAILKRTEADESTAARAEKIGRAARRCAQIVQNFLALARKGEGQREAVQLNDVVRDALALLADQMRVSNIALERQLDDALPPLWADPNQLHQVVVNLVANARQALAGRSGARLVVGTRFDPARRRAVLVIEDNGPGIPADIRARIFEPFFTTKPGGLGTGLGLSLSRGIVEGHGGTIDVVSERDPGTTFVVELPVADSDVATVPGPSRPASLEGRRILIVDDEIDIAEMLKTFLIAEGCQVDLTRDGEAAWEKLRDVEYDAIVADVRMPGWDGIALYERIREQRPHLLDRLVFLTADAFNRETAEFLESTSTPVVTKPCEPEEVRYAIEARVRRDAP